jgi:hypothetical protein
MAGMAGVASGTGPAAENDPPTKSSAQGQDSSHSATQVYREPAQDVPVLGEYEVIVCGGGPAGCAAALAAARHGAKTLLVEREGYLGGSCVMALVNVVLSTNGADFQGVWHEWARTLQQLNGIAKLHRSPSKYTVVGWWLRNSVDPEMVKFAWDKLLAESGVELLHHAHLAGAIVEEGRLHGVLVETVAGRHALYAQRTIDCTGDAVVCARAGAEWEQGYGGSPLGMGVDLNGLRSSGQESVLFECDGGGGTSGNRPERRTGFRMRGYDVLDPWQMSRATQEARRHIWGNGQVMGKPYLILTASRLGVRSTRRVQGLATVTASDAFTFRKYPDGIARSSWEIDIHPPSDDPIPVSLKNANDEYRQWQRRLAEGEYFDIRYGCLVVKNIDHLLVAGRCLSAEHEAQSSLRIQQTCMATGQAAGTAAAMSLKRNTTPRELDPLEVVAQLETDRAAVEPAFELLDELPLARPAGRPSREDMR